MSVVYLEISNDNPLDYKFSKRGCRKFIGDDFVYDDSSYFVIMNGVNLLFKSVHFNDNAKYCIAQYEKYGDTFFKIFRGSFSGIFLDKRLGKWIIFTNHVGDQKLYYTKTQDKLIISSDVFLITECLRKADILYSLNKNAAYCLLSYGYMIGDNTLVNDLFRLTAGKYLIFNGTHLLQEKYYEIDNTPNYKNKEKDLIEQLDSIFRNAVESEFNKDLQYGYKHIASMSGGLDCRMTNFVAHDLGYDNITNITFSQYGYLDMSLAHEMSSYLDHEWIFQSLDNGNYLKNIDDMVRTTQAGGAYGSSAHADSFNQNLNFDSYGAIHMGQLGDVTIGTYHPQTAYEIATGAKSLSQKFIYKTVIDFSKFKNQELATYNIRGLNGILTGNFTYQKQTEALSAFLDVDFLNFCFSMPIKYRAYHNIYKKWILQKYPEAANFKWESINAKISEKSFNIKGKSVPISQMHNFIIDGIKYRIGKNSKLVSAKGMNPLDFWLNTNKSLSSYFKKYFDDHIDLVDNVELRNDLLYLNSVGNCTEKILILTLLSAIKQLQIKAC